MTFVQYEGAMFWRPRRVLYLLTTLLNHKYTPYLKEPDKWPQTVVASWHKRIITHVYTLLKSHININQLNKNDVIYRTDIMTYTMHVVLYIHASFLQYLLQNLKEMHYQLVVNNWLFNYINIGLE